jgi:glycosyltransferase involved in cell wall biosynthesis
LKLLIAGASSKFFHLEEFGEALTRAGSEYRLVSDVETYTGFPSRQISKWFDTKKKFNNLIDEFKPDAIFIDRHAHFGLAALQSNIPLLVHLRGDYWSEIQWAKETLYRFPVKRTVLWLKDRMAKQIFKDCTQIFPICDYLHDIVDVNYSNKSNVLYQGIDPSRWVNADGCNLKHPCVGLLQGAVIWGKAREMFTLKKVLEAMPEVTFYWAGDGPYKDKILQELGKFPNFKWLGALEYPEKVREYLSEIDVYALVSGIDMSPLTLQEAQLMQKPVVATKIGGIPEIMKNNETGFLVDVGDYEAWIEKLTLLLNDSKKSKMMGNAGRTFVKSNFNWDKIAKDFLNSVKI